MIYNIPLKGEKMENKFHNTKVYKSITIISLIIIILIFAFIPVYRANLIKTALYKQRYNQIQYLNSKSDIVPKAINIIKGYIIHNEKALKDIVYINVLTKTKSNSIKEIYNNQIQIFSITKKLMDNANKNSPLANNDKFTEIKQEFDDVYSTMIQQFNICKNRTKNLQRYINLPIYKSIIDTTNINDIICID